MRRSILMVLLVGLCALATAAVAETIAPLAISQAAIGGAALNEYTPGVEGGVGVNNIGLLIKTWGKVTFVDTTNKFFYVNDGNGRMDGSGHVGVRISYDNLAAGNIIAPPALDAYVAVTGISSTVMISISGVSKVQPNVRPRRQADIQSFIVM